MDALTARQAMFAAEYLIDLNATQAAIRAGYSERTAEQQGSRLLTNVKVAAAIEAAKMRRIERVEISQDEVLQRYWALATADPNELMQLRRLCCRHCYGRGHAYQWRDPAEFAQAVADAAAKERKPEEVLPAPLTDEGGFGYRAVRGPVATCPQCDGEGVTDVYLADTRKLSASGKLLFAGVKATQHGIEIKTQDRMAALDAVARHLGMFKTSVELTGRKALDDALASLDDDE